MFATPAAGAEDPTHIPNHVLQRLRNVDFGSFSGNVEENPTQWIQSAQNKLNQVECPQRFWRSEVAIRLTHDAALWSERWIETTHAIDQTWDNYKAAFLVQFAPPDTEVRIARAAKCLRHTGSIQEYIRAWDELRLRAPAGMDFDSVGYRLDFFNHLKPHVLRLTDFTRAYSMRELYAEARAAEQKAETLHQALNAAKVAAGGHEKRNPRGGKKKEEPAKPYSRPQQSHGNGNRPRNGNNGHKGDGTASFNYLDAQENYDDQGKDQGGL
jgi:hypothetical protein